MNEDETGRRVDRLAWMVPDRAVPMGQLVAASTRLRRRRRRVRIGIAVATAAVVVGAAAVALGATPATRANDRTVSEPSDAAPSPTQSSACPTGWKYEPHFDVPFPSEPPYPTNANGQTYGSDAGVNKNPLQFGPVLAAVVGDCGKAGFVYEADLMGPQPTSPAGALRIQRANGGHPRVLQVYEVDGTTQIDTFTMG
jgi:hypothetical protein